MTDTPRHDCNLCGDRRGEVRYGRLGRYNVTCDTCEARRGSHLEETALGYSSRLVPRPAPVLVA